MRNGQLVFSATQFFLTVALIGFGIGCIVLDHSQALRCQLADWLCQPTTSLLFIGLLSLVIGGLLGIGFWMMQRGGFVRLRMHKGPISIHEELVRKAVQQFWIEHYPDARRPSEIFVSHKKIEIVSEDPELDLEELEQRLGDFFANHLGYRDAFFLTKKI